MPDNTGAGRGDGAADTTDHHSLNRSERLFEQACGLNRDQLDTLSCWLVARLRHGDTHTPPFPPTLRADNKPRTLFLSVAAFPSPCEVVTGMGAGIQAAAHDALRQLATIGQPARSSVIKIDIVRSVEPVTFPQGMTPPGTDRSLHGFAFSSPQLAVLPEEILACHLITSSGKCRWNALRGHFARRHADTLNVTNNTHVKGWRFVTDAWYSDDSAAGPLYRGHPESLALSAERIATAISAAGAYLGRAVDGTGRFLYAYQPQLDQGRAGYNILRHAGTTWAMLDLVRETGNRALHQATERAVGYLLRAIVPCLIAGRHVQCLVEKGAVKLGGQGLALVCLAAHATTNKTLANLSLMQGLAQWIVHSQSPTGEFVQHKVMIASGKKTDLQSGYYPGEAMLGLLRLYAIDGRQEWLDAAIKAAHWLIGVRDGTKTSDTLEHDHWLLYALHDLHHHAPSPLYLAHTRKLVKAIIRKQHKNPASPDWLGGWYRPPRTTPAATRTEGLAAAYALLRDHGASAATIAGIMAAIEDGLRYQLHNQYSPVSAMYLPNPAAALGGFRGSFLQLRIRIDYVQHSLSALLLYRRLIQGHGAHSEA